MLPGIANTTTKDALLGGAMMLRQPAKGYRLTSDAVLLAAMTPLRPQARVLELGVGYGQVSLCLLARVPDISVTGLELMPQSAQLARVNANLNQVADRLTIIEGDVATTRLSGFDVVVSNPPYRLAASHTASDDPIKAAATIERVPLAMWCQAAAQALTQGQGSGSQAIFIHDARRQADLVSGMQAAGLADVTVLPLVSKPGQEAKRIIARARCGAPSVRVLDGLVLHQADGAWVPAAEAALRAPVAMNVWPE